MRPKSYMIGDGWRKDFLKKRIKNNDLQNGSFKKFFIKNIASFRCTS